MRLTGDNQPSGLVKSVATGLLLVTVACGVRALIVHDSGVSLKDLHRFEEEYGLDLPEFYERYPYFLYWTLGDGQAFVAIASDLDGNAASRRLGVPAYRYSRVGFAIAGRLFVGGNLGLLPIGLFMVNVLSVFGLGVHAGLLAAKHNPAAILLAANPAIYIGLTGDTAEPFALALLTLALSRTLVWNPVFSGILGAVRPSYLTAVPASTNPIKSIFAAGVVAVTVFALSLRWFGTPLPATASQFSPPFIGYFETWGVTSTLGRLSLITIGCIATLSIISSLRHSGNFWTRTAFLSSGILVLSLDTIVLLQPVNAWRAVGALVVLVALRHPLFSGVRPVEDHGDRLELQT